MIVLDLRHLCRSFSTHEPLDEEFSQLKSLYIFSRGILIDNFLLIDFLPFSSLNQIRFSLFHNPKLNNNLHSQQWLVYVPLDSLNFPVVILLQLCKNALVILQPG